METKTIRIVRTAENGTNLIAMYVRNVERKLSKWLYNNKKFQLIHILLNQKRLQKVLISAHVYANNQEQVIEEAFNTYLKAIQTARDNKIQLVPMEENEKY